VRKVYILPNLFTAGSLFCGLLAVFEIIELPPRGDGDLVKAVHLLILAGFLDAFDGMVARMTRSQSKFGLNFDSLSDTVTFGVAPALLSYMYVAPTYPLLAKATGGLFVICGALRLARYNVQVDDEERRGFVGLPIPAAAAITTCFAWVLALRPESAAYFPLERVLPVVMVIASYLMVSKLPYGGIKALSFSRRQPFEILVISVVVASILFAMKDVFEIIMFALFLAYTATGPVKAFRDYKSAKAAGSAAGLATVGNGAIQNPPNAESLPSNPTPEPEHGALRSGGDGDPSGGAPRS